MAKTSRKTVLDYCKVNELKVKYLEYCRDRGETGGLEGAWEAVIEINGNNESFYAFTMKELIDDIKWEIDNQQGA